MRSAWVCLAIALAACDASPAEDLPGLCSAVCRCTASLPGQQRACVDQCIDDTSMLAITDECAQCVRENAASCSHLADRCFADGGACRPQPDPFPGGFPDAQF
jgi:hypothetical protein